MADEIGGLKHSDPETKTNTQSDDEISNLKAEMNRKLGNHDETLSKIAEQNKLLTDQLQQSMAAQQQAQVTRKKAAQDSVHIGDLLYEDANKAVEVIQQRAEERALGVLRTQQEAQAKQNAVMADIMQAFPEVSDVNHPLTKRAVEIYGKMEPSDRALPMSYRVAVMEAAAEQSIQPVSKREPGAEEAFTMSGSSSGTQVNKKQAQKNQDAMLKFAEIMGIDVNDEKQVARLKNRERENWKRYR